MDPKDRTIALLKEENAHLRHQLELVALAVTRPSDEPHAKILRLVKEAIAKGLPPWEAPPIVAKISGRKAEPKLFSHLEWVLERRRRELIALGELWPWFLDQKQWNCTHCHRPSGECWPNWKFTLG